MNPIVAQIEATVATSKIFIHLALLTYLKKRETFNIQTRTTDDQITYLPHSKYCYFVVAMIESSSQKPADDAHSHKNRDFVQCIRHFWEFAEI